MFATRVRYSGFSIGYNICVAAFGGTTPYVVTGSPRRRATIWPPPVYLIGAAIVSLATVLTLRETAARPLPQTSEQQEAAAIQ